MMSQKRSSRKKRNHPLSHAREIALQGLYQIELKAQTIKDIIKFGWLNQEPEEIKKQFAVHLITQVSDNTGPLDLAIHIHSKKHRTQISSITRCVLRMAVFELQNAQIAPAIVIDEYLELVRKYDNEDAVGFVNAILDAFRMETEEVGTGEDSCLPDGEKS